MAMQIRTPGGRLELRRVKPPAVAGLFYPADRQTLRAQVRAFLDAAQADEATPPKALIAPHAGYPYSGPVAGTAYASLRAQSGKVKRVVLLGPAHRVPFPGAAVSSAEAFNTPLGAVPVDRHGIDRALEFGFVSILDAAFAEEHSLEVHLPFLIETLEHFSLVPLLVGDAEPEQAGALIDALWGGPETLVVISSDLSHYHDYETAVKRDAATSNAIESLNYNAIGYSDACGRNAVNGLLLLSRARHLEAKTVDLRNSGDTAGSRDRVVGYGAYLFREKGPGVLTEADQGVLLGIAAGSIRHGLNQGAPAPVDTGQVSPPLCEARASFVTLRLDGELRGCIGTLEASRPLVQDVAVNAFAAAFSDKRFKPVTAGEAERLNISISVLSPPEPLMIGSEAELLAALRPGVDGLVIEEDENRATFLPAVWSGLSEPAAFVGELKKKAGLEPDYWSDRLVFKRYTVKSFS